MKSSPTSETSVFTPVNLSRKQIMQESGGKQFDRSGKPLTSSAGAIGVAQVMPATAREVAREMGIAFDEHRYKNDKDYNMRLGDFYQGKMDRMFGKGTREATAAYNAGPGRVQQAKRKHGADWERHMPAETQDYLAKIIDGLSGEVAKENGETRLAVSPILRDRGSSELPTGDKTMVRDVFATDNDRLRYEETERRALLADDVTTKAIGALESVQDTRRERLVQRNELITGMNQEILERTEAVGARIKPLFQQKQAIIDRQMELTQMNPLERGFMSLFDASYDRKHLSQVGQVIDASLANSTAEYETVLNLQNNVLKIVQSQYETSDSIDLLDADFQRENITLASQSFNSAQTLFQNSLAGASANSALLAAQHTTKQAVLAGMTPAQMVNGLETVKANGGQPITIEGVQFTEGELLKSAQDAERQQLELDDFVSIQNSRTIENEERLAGLADRQEQRVLGTMTTPQLMKLVQNGYKTPEGVAFNPTFVGAALQTTQRNDAAIVGQTAVSDGKQIWANGVRGLSNQLALASRRSVGLMGKQPDSLTQLGLQIEGAVKEGERRILAAPADQRAIVAAEEATNIAKLQAAHQEGVMKAAQQWAGGNKKLLPIATAYMTGQELNPIDSARGVIEMVRRGVTPGQGMSTEARTAFAKVQELVLNHDKPAGAGVGIEAMMGGADSATARLRKEEELERQIASTFVGARNEAVLSNVLPQVGRIAKSIQHIGAELNPELVQQAQVIGETEALTRVGQRFGMAPDQTKKMLDAGEAGPLWKAVSVSPAAEGRTFRSFQDEANGIEMSITMKVLDQNHPRIGKFKAGRVYADLLNQPKFAQVVGQLSQAGTQTSFGDYLAGSAGSTDITAQVAQFGRTQYNQYLIDNRNEMKQRVAGARYSQPKVRFGVTVASIIADQNDRIKLINAVSEGAPPISQKELIQATRSGLPTSRAPTLNDENFNRMRDFLMNTKFDDPDLERIRRKAAQGFDTAVQQADAVINGLDEAED